MSRFRNAAGERAVAAVAVGGDFIRRGGIGHHHALGLVDLGEPAAHGIDGAAVAGLLLAAKRVDDRIVAARIEDHDLDAVAAVERGAHVVERRHLVTEADLVLDFGVGRHQVVAALILDGMTGVIEQRGVGVDRQPSELGHVQIEIALVGVDRLQHLETDAAERRGNVGGVVLRIGQEQARIAVVRVADNQRNAPVSLRNADRTGQQHETIQSCNPDRTTCAHIRLRNCSPLVIATIFAILLLRGRTAAGGDRDRDRFRQQRRIVRDVELVGRAAIAGYACRAAA